MYLLQHVQERYENPSAYGSYIRPGTVLKCEGKDRTQPNRPDLSVTFISYPYFDVCDGKWPDPPTDNSLHLTRGLFQQSYPQEVARDRDNQQSFRKFKRPGHFSHHFLRVPQLWILILDSTTIISCGPSSITSTFGGAIEIVSEESLLGGTQSLIRVFVESTKKNFFLSLETCRTFLALRSSIQKECLEDANDRIDDCVLYVDEEKNELNSGHWPKILQTKGATLICIYVRPRNREPTIMIESSKNPLAIEHADLSSDNEQGKALIRWAPT